MIPRSAERFDLLRVAIAVFVLLGVALTGVAGFALWRLGGQGVTLSPGAAVSVLSGVSLIVFAVVLTKWVRSDQVPRRNV